MVYKLDMIGPTRLLYVEIVVKSDVSNVPTFGRNGHLVVREMIVNTQVVSQLTNPAVAGDNQGSLKAFYPAEKSGLLAF